MRLLPVVRSRRPRQARRVMRSATAAGEELLYGPTRSAPVVGVPLSAGELVRALVQLDPGVTGDLHPFHLLVTVNLGEQLLPQFTVLHGLSGRRPPAVTLPTLTPALGKGVQHVAGIDVDPHPRGRG